MTFSWNNPLAWLFILFGAKHDSTIESGNSPIRGGMALHPVPMRSENDDLVAARAAITVLRNLSTDSEGAASSRVKLGAGRVLADSEAAVVLAATPKPIQCRAELVEGTLEIDCGPVAEENQWIQSAREQLLQHDLAAQVGSDQLILFTGSAASMIVSGADAARFDSQYILLGTYDVITNMPPAARTDGVVLIRYYRWAHPGMQHD